MTCPWEPPSVPPIPDYLAHLPRAGGLVLPFTAPTHGKVRIARTDVDLVAQCARQRRCMLCGEHIRKGEPYAFVFYESASVGDCSSDPWLHVPCAEYTVAACPFLAGRRTEIRTRGGNDELARWLNSRERTFRIGIARKGSTHRDARGTWHFTGHDWIEMRNLRPEGER